MKKILKIVVMTLVLGVVLNTYSSFVSQAIDEPEVPVALAGYGPLVLNNGRVSNNNPDCGEVVEIFFDLENIGDAAAVGFIWRVPIDSAFSPVAGSLKLNGVAIPGLVGNNINVNVPTMEPGDKLTYSYQVTLRNFPNNASRFVVTTATLFEADMTEHNHVLFSVHFKPLDVRMAQIDPVSQIVNIGDTVDYTFNVTNNSCFPVNNYSIRTTLPAEMSIIPGSLTIGGVTSPGIDLDNNSINAIIATLALGQTVEVKFKGVVNTMPSTPDPNISGNGLLNHTITLHDSHNVAVTTANRRISVIDNVELPVLSKSVSQTSSFLNSELTYNVTVKNDGLSTLSNYTLEDILPAELGFVDGSLNIDGVVQPNPTGNSIMLSLVDIAPGATIDVSYKATINTIPTNPYRTITNIATLKDGSGTVKDTQQAVTTVNLPEFEINKTVDVTVANIMQEVEYTIEVVNKNAFELTNYVVTDILSNYLTYVDNSLELDGVSFDGISGQDIRITIPTIAANTTSVIKYKAVVNSMPSTMDPVIPTNGLIPNTAILLNSASEQLAQSTHNLSVDPGAVDVTLNSTVSKAVADFDEILTYTFTVKNNGFVAVNDYTVENIVAPELTMVDGTFTINSVVQFDPGANVNVVIPQLSPGQSYVIVYEARITAFPSNPQNEIINTVVLKDASDTVVTSIDNTTVVNLPSVGISKLVNKTMAQVDDVITYTIIVQNNNAYAIENYVVNDVVSDFLSIDQSTLMLDGTLNNGIVGQNINVTIPSIAANSQTTVTFDATINQFPSIEDPNNVGNGLISNTATLFNPSNINVGQSTTNTSVIAQVFNVGLEKTVLEATADFNTELTYMIEITNEGNATINNYTLVDTLPAQLTLVSGSFEVNGVIDNSIVSNDIELLIKNLGANETMEIKYRALIVAFPSNPTNLIVNDALIKDENGVTQAASQAFTQVNLPIVEINKTVDNPIATIGDVLNYTIEVKNLNAYPINGYTVQDVLASELNYVQDSLKLNGDTLNGFVDNTINVDTLEIAANSSANITYSVEIASLPTKADPIVVGNGLISNTAILFNPSNDKLSESTVDVSVDPGADDVRLVSSVSKAVAEFDEILTYTFTVTNNGLVPVKDYGIENLVAPEITMVDGTFTINGFVQSDPGANVNVVIPQLNPGESFVVVYQARITSFPGNAQNTIINTVVLKDASGTVVTTIDNTTVVNLPKVTINKLVNSTLAKVDDILTYTITVQNNNAYAIDNYVINDVVSDYLSVNETSLMLDGTPNNGITGQNINVTIPSIAANSQATVTFEATINQFPSTVDPSIDGNGLISNTATLFNASNINVGQSTTTTSVIAQVFNVTLEKTVLEATADFNTELTYMIEITNQGNATINNYSFVDTLPVELALVPGSFAVNGVVDNSIDSNDIELLINNLTSNDTMSITYKALIVGFSSNADNTIVNDAMVKDENGVLQDSSQAITQVNLPIVEIEKTVDSSLSAVGNVLNYTIEVKNQNAYPINGYTVQDVLANELMYVQDSLKLNGVAVNGIVDNTIHVDTLEIAANASSYITYSVEITSFPTMTDPSNVRNGLISNTAILFDPSNDKLSESIVDVSVDPGADDVSLVSSVSKAVADFDEILTYTFTVRNNGLVPVNDYSIENILAAEITLVDGTFTINRVVQDNPDTSVNITIPILNPGEQYEIVYQARITSFPGRADMASYQIDTENTIVNTVVLRDADGNVVTSIDNLTVVNAPKVAINKVVNKSVAKVEDVLTYTIVVENNNAYDLQNYVVLDIVSEYLSVNNETLMLDGTLNDGITGQDINVTIPNISANSQATITFDATINQFPSIEDPSITGNGLISNTATLFDSYNVNVAESSTNTSVVSQEFSVGLEKTVLEATADFNDEITYMIKITNEGNTTINNYMFEDLLPAQLTLVPSSFEVNGVVDESIDSNHINMIINDLGENQVIEIKYKAKITDFPQSSNRLILNEAFVKDENDTIIASSQAITTVNSPKVQILKSVDNDAPTVGDTLKYTIEVKNLNEYPINGYSVEDVLASEMDYVEGSLQLNGVEIDGIVNNVINVNTQTIEANESAFIIYSVKIETLPSTIDPGNEKNGLISNTATLYDMYENKVGISSITTSVSPIPDEIQKPDQRLPVTGNDSGYKVIGLYLVMASLFTMVAIKRKETL